MALIAMRNGPNDNPIWPILECNMAYIAFRKRFGCIPEKALIAYASVTVW